MKFKQYSYYVKLTFQITCFEAIILFCTFCLQQSFSFLGPQSCAASSHPLFDILLNVTKDIHFSTYLYMTHVLKMQKTAVKFCTLQLTSRPMMPHLMIQQ